MVEILAVILAFMAASNIALAVLLFIIIGKSEKRISNLLDRVMSKDFTEYSTNNYRMKKADGKKAKKQTPEEFMAQYNNVEDMLADLEANGVFKQTVVPVV